MSLNKNKKALFLTNVENGLEPILEKETNIQQENMMIIQSYGAHIAHPYGDIMRSIIIAIYLEGIEEIYVVESENKRDSTINILTQLDKMKGKIQTLNYLFRYSKPEFPGGTVEEWLNGKENDKDKSEKSVDVIRRHPLVPSYVKVQGLAVNNKDGTPSSIEA